jgi:hypothetical protein
VLNAHFHGLFFLSKVATIEAARFIGGNPAESGNIVQNGTFRQMYAIFAALHPAVKSYPQVSCNER